MAVTLPPPDRRVVDVARVIEIAKSNQVESANSSVRMVKYMLYREGFGDNLSDDGRWGANCPAAYARWERTLPNVVDNGVPDVGSLRRLCEKYGVEMQSVYDPTI